MSNTKFLTIAVLVSLLGLPVTQAFASIDSDYFGAYPDIGSKRDATYVYTTCNFSGTSIPSGDNNLECIASSAEQDSSGNINPYMSQNYALYNNSNSHIVYYSEVWYINSNNPPSAASAYTCETNGCTDLGAASGIGNVNTLQFWNSGDIKYYTEVYDTSGNFVNAYYNPTYVPGSGDTSSKFASGTDTQSVSGYKLKLTQWGVEGELPNAPSGWYVEQSGMSTWYPSTSSPFSSDTARTTDPAASLTADVSHITYRVVSGTAYLLQVGEYNYCMHRNNNVAGDIQWQYGGTCISAGTQLW